MNIETLLDVYMLFAAGVGLFLCIYRYVETPRKVYVFSTLFFLAHFISDYYWTIYLLIMSDYPNISALLAYFGWNVSYIFIILLIFTFQSKEESRFITPLMFIPIPINIAQYILYMQFGGFINNTWQGITCTLISVLCIRSLVYWRKQRKNGVVFPWFQLAALLFMVAEYSMWTVSCFDWEIEGTLYNIFTFINITVSLFMCWTVKKSFEQKEDVRDTKNEIGPRFRMVFQVLVAAIICICCAGGYIYARRMKNEMALLRTESAAESDPTGIAITLFAISLIFAVVIVLLMLIVQLYYRYKKKKFVVEFRKKGRFNFLFTLSITFVFMVVAVIYTSTLLFREASSSLLGKCEDEVASISATLSNYLDTARSVLWVTADSIDQMRVNGIENDKIHEILRVESRNQADQFDENFTGIYGYIRGEYLDGLDWEAPEGYDPVQRDWYRDAVWAGGDVAIVSPYVDAQTGNVIISICKLLTDKESVVSLDVTLNYIQDLVSEINVNGCGYGMIIDKNGMIISHPDREMNGHYVGDVLGTDAFLNEVLAIQNGSLDIDIDGERNTVFVYEVDDQWYTVVVVERNELFSDIYLKLVVNTSVYLLIFSLITFFYFMSYKNEQSANRRMEELIKESQKQEYEARILKLEKSAADEANKAKSRFLADMSHEIRTPINTVLGMNEMILREADDANILEYADSIRTSGKTLLNLINSILDFSKIEDGKMDIVPVDYKTAEMVRYLYASVAERAAGKGLEFTVSVDPLIPVALHGDDMRLTQVIMNLLTNAVKYTQEGKIEFSLKNAGRNDDSIMLRVEVKDTGIGIRSEDMPKLFESFERLEVEKNRSIEGTGLGMSIVTRLLSMMGSKLSVESEYGVGSRFYFDIKQGIACDEIIGEFSVTGEGDRADDRADRYHESFHAPEAKILIVDDTKMNLKVASNFLKKTMMKIDTSISGSGALALCSEVKYDIILMDQRMPGMDGTQTMLRLKEDASGLNADTPVICLTADAISGARDTYISQGFTDYLSKPIDGQQLEKMLTKYLPAGKVFYGEEKVVENSGNCFDKEKYKTLAASGMDLESAYKFCQGEENLFKDVLGEYVAEAPEKRSRIVDGYEKKNWKNYSVYTHSLKSTSRLIGATELSEIAERMEKASNDKNEEAIAKEHDKMLMLYEKIVSSIKDYMVESGESASAPVSSEDEILEFSPQ